MTDYENMPHLRWDGEASAVRAAAQILREEPVILEMPARFAFPDDLPCPRRGDDYIDCPPEVLDRLAESDPALARVAQAAREAEQRVDLLPHRHWIVVRD